jgi:uncharacterized protein YutE (UPF0331/DUF86 family)
LMRKPLPRSIARRIVELPSHIRALRENLERITLEEYRRALVSRTTSDLNTSVYPLERPFEIVDNIVLELAEEGLAATEKATGPDRPADLRRLRDLGVITTVRCKRLIDCHRVRNEAQHGYVDIDPKIVYEAAIMLPDEAIDFLRDYVAWLRKRGFELP